MDQCQTEAALNVTLLFAVAHIITPHRFGPYRRDDRVAFPQLHKGDVEYII